MIDTRPIYRLLHLVLQADTAHGIQSGRGDATHDVLLVRDANGLPAIPATSLAGVLRHHMDQRHGSGTANALFGTLVGEGQPSWLQVDWGLVHDSHNRPHEGLLDPSLLQADPLLDWLRNDKPIVRQRVRLSHRGSAEDTGKFDVTLLPAGLRYSHWLGYWCDGSDQSLQQWQQLLELLAEGQLYLGHGTHAGNGHFRINSLHTASWDLRQASQRTAYQQRPRLRRDIRGLAPLALAGTSKVTQVRLLLQAEAAWRVGSGEHSLQQHEGKLPDLLPQHELRVVWENGKGKLGTHSYLLPGSAIKGALRHRVAFHHRRLSGQWASTSATLEDAADCPAVRELFGHAEQDQGQAGLLHIADLHLPTDHTAVLMHNRIDRFTGGVIHGGLFSEEVLWNTPLTLDIQIDARRHPSTLARQALQHALQDLANGALPLGAGGSRGLGTFIDPTGQGPQWSDHGAWLQATDPEHAHL